MIFRIFIAIVVFAFVELALLLWFASAIGWLRTLAIVVGSAFLGLTLGVGRSLTFPDPYSPQHPVGPRLSDRFCLLLGGILLILPGIITDIVGLALLFGPTRQIVKRLVQWLFLRFFERRLDIITGAVDSRMRGDVESPLGEPYDSENQHVVIQIIDVSDSSR